MILAAGIDVGGTKIEAQTFAPDWSATARRRFETPRNYAELVAVVVDQIRWAREQAPHPVPVGISAAGLVNRTRGLALTANLPATGHPFPADIEAAGGCRITYLNDCRAFTLSEAIFGAGRDANFVAGLILGTGVGGGVVVDRQLLPGSLGLGGEFGHTYAPAHLAMKHGLPVMRCGCGRTGCIEMYVSGPGLTRIAEVVTGKALTPPAIAAAKDMDSGVARVWEIWCEFTAELLMSLTLTLDPEIIVLGGGLSQIDGLVADLSRALSSAQFESFPVPRVVLAEGGDASGARGAAYAAFLAAGNSDV